MSLKGFYDQKKKQSGKCGLKQYSVEVLTYSDTICVLLSVLRLL